jgi:hypothetical protein
MQRIVSEHTSTVGILGTIGTWFLSQANVVLGVLCSICTLIVIAPKAWDQLKEWHRQFKEWRKP